MKTQHQDIAAGKSVDRAQVLTILQVALQAGEERFVRQLADDWLNAFPYDLPVEYLRSKALFQDGMAKKALQILMRLTELDPEYLDAHELLAHLARRVKAPLAESARAAATALSIPKAVPNDIEEWAQAVIRANHALAKNDLKAAEGHVHTALQSNPPSPLPALSHLRLAREQGLGWMAIHKLLELYSQLWPHCLQIKLLQAEHLMESGEEDEAVDLLHQCAAEDVTGRVARRLWGEDHRFSTLWPASLSRPILIPIPAKVVAGLGWNQLQSGTLNPKKKSASTTMPKNAVEIVGKNGTRQKSTPETPINLEDIATQTEEDLKLRADGRFPSYVILSSKAALESQYGDSGFEQIDAAIRELALATSAQPNWAATVLYADDETSTSKFGLQAVNSSDPWEVKHLLSDLDKALRANGEMIGALLIVGGANIIPFHHLPNPVDDDDKDVPSDNPYASVDENYFVPSWPTGRLPGGEGKDPNRLVNTLNAIISSRGQVQPAASSLMNLIKRFLTSLGLWKPRRNSFGYSAEIWRRASHSVYRPIGEPRKLSVSPPTASGQLPKEASTALELAYFNLHGLEDTAEWYGQRDPVEQYEGPDYPIALSPKDIVNSGRAPQVVFSEACFGANIFGKTTETAMALKFLASGSKAVIGSTCTSYGSVTTPLIAADLLGQTFWKLLNEGHPAGEALRRAKIALARAMHRRQGYLDGEDQKTLISFVLFGDPLARAQVHSSIPKRIMRPLNGSPEITAVCDKAEHAITAPQDIPAETLATVKSVVKEYLPGMQESSMRVSHEHLDCEGHDCPIPHSSAKSVTGMAPTRQLVTLSKQVQGQHHQHPSYARITMDEHGKVVKLAVSR